MNNKGSVTYGMNNLGFVPFCGNCLLAARTIKLQLNTDFDIYILHL